jgi:hypothetical protein
MPENDDRHDLYDELERRAFDAMPDDDDAADEPDLLDELRPAPAGDDAATTAAAEAADVTLGGYIELHQRVPAFEGSDGMPYTVDIDVDDDAGDGTFAAFLVFIRWAATGAGIMDHVESGDVATGASAEEARQAALDLSLYEVRAELDAAIARRRAALDEAEPS